MRQRTQVVAALTTVGIAIAVSVPMAIAAIQGSDDLSSSISSRRPPRTGASDYFSYSLTVTMEGVTRPISWVDEFAASADSRRA